VQRNSPECPLSAQPRRFTRALTKVGSPHDCRPRDRGPLCLIASLDWARTQQAKSWELRTATSYARLMRDQARAREAYELLASVYGWFTEGFATKDLKDAKTLLDELA
jgi:predicted ATPase